MSQPAPIAVALDAPDLETAARWAGLVTPHVSTVKIGLELYLRYGPGVVASIRGRERRAGLPRPETARHPGHRGGRGPGRGPAAAGPGHRARRRRGRRSSGRPCEAAPDTTIAAVTVLTSLSPDDLERDRHARAGAGRGAPAGRRWPSRRARGRWSARRARWPRSAAEVGPDIMLITPGVRPAGADRNDQARVATPEEALRAGADLLVIGRPITGAPDPGRPPQPSPRRCGGSRRPPD